MVASRFQQQGSGDSTGAVDSLDSLRQQVEQLEYELDGLEERVKQKRIHGKNVTVAMQQLGEINGSLEELQYSGIDSVVISGLGAGKQEAAVLQKQLTTFQERVGNLNMTLQHWKSKSGTSFDFSMTAKDQFSSTVPWRSRTVKKEEQQDLNSSADEVIQVDIPDEDGTHNTVDKHSSIRPSSPSRKMSEAKRFDGFYNPDGVVLQIAEPLACRMPVPVNSDILFDYEEDGTVREADGLTSKELAYKGRDIFKQCWMQGFY